MTVTQIIFWILLADSLIAGYVTWFGNRVYWNNMAFFKRFMPLTKGWTAWYLILVLFIGDIVYFN